MDEQRGCRPYDSRETARIRDTARPRPAWSRLDPRAVRVNVQPIHFHTSQPAIVCRPSPRQWNVYQYDFDLRDITELWRRGSVIASWLLDLTATAFVQDPGLSDFSGRVSDSGEGRWTINAAIDEAIPVPVLSAALYQRFSSRGESQFADRVLSAMRYEFGGHREMAASVEGPP
jgi:6-phosphogluconate dehydrogenase (decarboxylating)